MVGCRKKLKKALSPGVIVFCGEYNSRDDYIHLCSQCRLEKLNDVKCEDSENA